MKTVFVENFVDSYWTLRINWKVNLTFNNIRDMIAKKFDISMDDVNLGILFKNKDGCEWAIKPEDTKTIDDYSQGRIFYLLR